MIMDINNAAFFQLDPFDDGDEIYKAFEENMRKKEGCLKFRFTRMQIFYKYPL